MVQLKRWTKRLILFLVAIIFGYFIFILRSIFIPFVIAVVIAYLLNPIVSYFEKKGVPRVFGIVMVYFMILTVLMAGAAFLLPLFIAQLDELVEQLPFYANRIQRLVNYAHLHYSRVDMPQEIRDVLDGYIVRWQQGIISFIESMLNSTIKMFSQIVNFVLAPIIAFYFLNDMDEIKRFLYSFFSGGFKGKTASLFHQIDNVLSGFIRGQLVVCLIVGTLTTIGLLILKVRFALIIGIIAGVTNIIPYFGPILGAIPAIALALMESSALALKVLILFIVIQQVESSIISPNIMRHNIGLHQLTIILALLAGGKLFGVLGLVIAVPIAGIIKVLLLYIYREYLERK